MEQHWQQESRVFALICNVYPRLRASQLWPRSNWNDHQAEAAAEHRCT
jgi:hypothetical protein